MFKKYLSPLKIKKKDTVYQNQWSSITRTIFSIDNIEKEVFTSDYGKRSGIILYKENKILFVRKYRLLIEDYSWEIPGGRVEDHESFEQAAIRECLEETGYRCNSLSFLVSFEPGLETLSNPTKIFISQDFKKEKPINESETIEVRWFKLEKLKTLMSEGFFCDSLTLTGLQSFFLKEGYNI